jgi:hypothetical protein
VRLLACAFRDYGSASKPHKIPSVHAIFIPAANASVETTASMSAVDIEKSSCESWTKQKI